MSMTSDLSQQLTLQRINEEIDIEIKKAEEAVRAGYKNENYYINGLMRAKSIIRETLKTN